MELAESVGWTYDETTDGHPRLRPPPGLRDPYKNNRPAAPRTFGKTPSDHRGDANTVAELRRLGVPIPHKGAGRFARVQAGRGEADMPHVMFRVEATLTPVADEAGWTKLRSVLDAVPETVLVEDAEEPVLIFPVEAESAFRAATFVDGLSKVVGFTIVSGSVGPALDLDVDDDLFDDEIATGEAPDTSMTRLLQQWVDNIPAVPSRRDLLSAYPGGVES